MSLPTVTKETFERVFGPVTQQPDLALSRFREDQPVLMTELEKLLDERTLLRFIAMYVCVGVQQEQVVGSLLPQPEGEVHEHTMEIARRMSAAFISATIGRSYASTYKDICKGETVGGVWVSLAMLARNLMSASHKARSG